MPDYGWALSQFELLARVSDPLLFYKWVAKWRFGDDVQGVVSLDPDPFSGTWNLYHLGSGPPHFPYGLPVEPDQF